MVSVALHLDDASSAEVAHVSRCATCLASLESVRLVLDLAGRAAARTDLPAPPAPLRSIVLRGRSVRRRRDGEAA